MSMYNFSSIVTDIASALTAKKASAAVAESLTGGMVASEIVRISGSSKWFIEGAVTYADDAKVRRLGVSRELIERKTAVCREVAQSMALGVRAASGADIAVSTTGLAGPGCDELGREAGLVYIAGAYTNGVVSKRLNLVGDRTQIREIAAYEALLLLRGLAFLL